jgi:hypothetical protein
MIEMIILFSPIYFPIVSWWNYDFRFRHDLKIQVRNVESVEKIARLSDLRRGAGCVSSFEDYAIGSDITLVVKLAGREFELEAEIFSRRQYSLGRPFIYGVKVNLETDIARSHYKELQDSYSDYRIDRHEKFSGERS